MRAEDLDPTEERAFEMGCTFPDREMDREDESDDMSIPTKELVAPEADLPARQSDAEGLALVVERVALNPQADVVKLEKIIELQERILRHQARAAFEEAFSTMQGELPIITEKGEIEVDGAVRSTYARYEDIIEIVRPILQKHGFSLRHRNRRAENGVLVVVGILSHRAGHAEEDEFECPPDTSGKKNSIQAMGSTRSYGQRYTTISLLNIVSRGADDDGEKSQAPDPPKGYDDWKADLTSTADNGWNELLKAFKASNAEFQDYAAQHDAGWKENLKAKAREVERAKARRAS